MKILALDFDGVISDSAPECFYVALRTLLRLRPVERFHMLLERWDEMDPARARSSIMGDPLYRGFLELMPLGNRAEDFGAALLALEAGSRIDDQAGYDRHVESLDPEFEADFHGAFYRERGALRAAEPERWAELMRPYSELIDVLRGIAGRTELAIATAKDGVSVALLLERYGISDLFGEGCVFDKEAGKDKRAHLRAVREHMGGEFAEITFVDDKANHLIRVRELGVRCLLAAWGYNGPREHAVAREHGIGVCDFDDLEALFPG